VSSAITRASPFSTKFSTQGSQTKAASIWPARIASESEPHIRHLDIGDGVAFSSIAKAAR
jgi:hypothetical protein